MFKSTYTTIIENINKSSGKGSGRIIDSIIDHAVSVSKYNHLAWSSYIKLPKELDHLRKGLINIQNTDDNEWCSFRYLNHAYHNPRRITKSYKDFAERLDFKDIRFPSKISKIHKIEKKNCLGISVFGYENKEKHPIYVSKNVVKKNMFIYYW